MIEPKPFGEAEKTVRDSYQRASKAIESGNVDYAIDLLFSCVGQEPGFLEARKKLRAAELLKQKSKRKSDMAQFIDMVMRYPLCARVKALARSGKHEDALQATERLLRHDPTNLKFVALFANVAVGAGLPDAAIETLELLYHQVYPENIGLINLLGELYVNVGRTRSARSCFERLCEIAPNDLNALKRLKDAMAMDSIQGDGWAKAQQEGAGGYRAVMKDIKKAELLEKENKAVKTDADAAALLVEMKRKVAAEPGNVNYYRQLARLHSQLHQYDEATAVLQSAREKSPGDAEIDQALTQIRLDRYDYDIERLCSDGREAEARKIELEKAQFAFDDLSKRVERYPNDLTLRFHYGVMLLGNDRVNEAIRQFQRAQRSPKHRSLSLLHLAMAFKAKQQYDLAVEQLQKAASEIVGMDATRMNIVYELGEIYSIMGEHEKAAACYKEIYAVDIGYRDIADKVASGYRTE